VVVVDTQSFSELVLVIDCHCFDNDPDVSIPEKVDSYFLTAVYNIISVLQFGINNSAYPVFVGAVISRGSAANGMFFNGGATVDYDAWEKQGNPNWV